jgi:hypothetical protein
MHRWELKAHAKLLCHNFAWDAPDRSWWLCCWQVQRVEAPATVCGKVKTRKVWLLCCCCIFLGC